MEGGVRLRVRDGGRVVAVVRKRVLCGGRALPCRRGWRGRGLVLVLLLVIAVDSVRAVAALHTASGGAIVQVEPVATTAGVLLQAAMYAAELLLLRAGVVSEVELERRQLARGALGEGGVDVLLLRHIHGDWGIVPRIVDERFLGLDGGAPRQLVVEELVLAVTGMMAVLRVHLSPRTKVKRIVERRADLCGKVAADSARARRGKVCVRRGNGGRQCGHVLPCGV
ncbi:hypothetical protein DFH07DRAFT_816853 [Mycena maculata]|uniref:Uncharacterized protein n=1 Tax=Mycena maculata TaxID=230809 RepID=A0AAD7NFK9_9AGAR|nr:hypothetical protein DFH07DRAFT_816853 [Mycena maculata]